MDEQLFRKYDSCWNNTCRTALGRKFKTFFLKTNERAAVYIYVSDTAFHIIRLTHGLPHTET